jgi:hypothetical protein
MTVGENVSLDCNPISDGALAGEPADINLGGDRLDSHTKPALGALLRGGRSRKRRNTDTPLDRNPSHGWNRATRLLPPERT